MKERRKPQLAREQLNQTLAKLKPLAESKRPIKGWLRALRTGLDISGVEMAAYLGVKPPRVVEMEKSELSGAITLKVLERAAEAMGCSLVYALIPRAGSLEQALQERALGAGFGGSGVPAGLALNLSDPADGDAPLSAEEAGDLRLSHIAARAEVERWEAQGIQEAEAWVFVRGRKDLPSPKSMPALHAKMFGKIWKSAGRFRDSDSGQGAPAREIASRLQELCDNFAHWSKARVFPPDEACARFLHRLHSIRPFARGNGRFARLISDALSVRVFGRPRFTWGTVSAAGTGLRKRYLEALRAADGRDYGPLIALLRS